MAQVLASLAEEKLVDLRTVGASLGPKSKRAEAKAQRTGGRPWNGITKKRRPTSARWKGRWQTTAQVSGHGGRRLWNVQTVSV